MSESFFAMGGYAFYVWWSFGLSAIVLVANLWWPLWRHARFVRQLADKLDQKHDTKS